MQKEIRIPFQGFYESHAEEKAEELAFQDYPESENYSDIYEMPEKAQEKFYDNFYPENHGKYQFQLVETYIDNLTRQLEKETNIKITTSEIIIDSPREYNFGTDRIFCKTDLPTLLKLYEKTDKTILKEIVKEQFTSHDGFSSFYENDLEKWEDPETGEWDHNQWCVVIECLMKQYEMIEEELYN